MSNFEQNRWNPVYISDQHGCPRHSPLRTPGSCPTELAAGAWIRTSNRNHWSRWLAALHVAGGGCNRARISLGPFGWSGGCVRASGSGRQFPLSCWLTTWNYPKRCFEVHGCARDQVRRDSLSPGDRAPLCSRRSQPGVTMESLGPQAPGHLQRPGSLAGQAHQLRAQASPAPNDAPFSAEEWRRIRTGAVRF